MAHRHFSILAIASFSLVVTLATTSSMAQESQAIFSLDEAGQSELLIDLVQDESSDETIPSPPGIKPAEPKAQSAPTPQRRQPRRRRRRRSVSRRTPFRLARAPDMMGDSIFLNTFRFLEFGANDVRFPTGSQNKFAENGNALPADRLWFDFRHFNNAMEISGLTPGVSRGLEQYTIGFERALTDDCSIQVVLPIIGGARIEDAVGSIEANGVGDITITAKQLLWQSADTAVSAGLGVALPTADDLRLNDGTSFAVVENEDVHLMPFLAFLTAPNERTFIHGAVQLDVATRGNGVIDAGGLVGRLNDPTLLYLDFSAGYWIRQPGSNAGRGLAALAEIHYSRPLQDSDQVVTVAGPGTLVGGVRSRLNIVNMTLGIHAEMGANTAIRGGYVVPLTDEQNRGFDGELILTVIRRI